MAVAKRPVLSSRFKAWREKYHLKPLISVILYLILPLVCIFFILQQYPLLDKARFYRMIMYIVPFGSGLFVVSLIQERHPKGTRSRLGLDALFVGLAMCWLFGFLGGRTVVESIYGGWTFTVDVTAVVSIGLFGTGLNFVHDVLEYEVHRRHSIAPKRLVHPVRVRRVARYRPKPHRNDPMFQ